jgi:creatinase
MERPDFFTLKNGEKVKLPFSKSEYDRRVNNLRTVMDQNNLDMVILTFNAQYCLLHWVYLLFVW